MYNIMRIVLLLFFLYLTACTSNINKVDVELDGFYSHFTFAGGDSVEIEGNSFIYDAWSDVINHPSLEKYPFIGTVEVKGEKIYLKHPHLDEKYNVYRVGIYKCTQYLIREMDYDNFLKKGIEQDGPTGTVFTKRETTNKIKNFNACKAGWTRKTAPVLKALVVR